MSTSLRFALLASASLLTGCASNHADPPSPSSSPVGNAPSPSPAPTTPVASPGFSGKINLAALPLLPPGKTAPASGYPGKTWRFGAFVAEDQWSKFLAAAGTVTGLSKIDWKLQVVTYLVLDAQTNALTYAGTRTDGDTVTLLVDRSGIEPFYPDSTPAVLAVIDRKNVDSLAVKIAGGPSDLGKISIK